MRVRDRPDGAVRRLRAVATVLGVPLILGGFLLTITEANARRRDDLYRALSTEAAQKSARLGDYFSRAHDLILVAAENPSLRDFFALPGDRAARVAAGGKVVDDVRATLRALHALYPDSIGEICYIDRGGAEIARLVHALAAAPADLSPDERSNQFFSSTIGLPPGQVFQAAPYLSPDTHTWVISNSTSIAGVDGTVPAVLHFEVDLESFRSSLAADHSNAVTRVFDARTGAVIIDSRFPQLAGAPVGQPTDRTFVPLVGSLSETGTVHVADTQIAYEQVTTGPNNENHWVVAVAAPAAATGWWNGISATTAATFLAAGVLIAGSMISTRAYRNRLEAAALTDALTGLANRTLFQERASQALAMNARAGLHVGVLLLDLDRFKEVNDTLGHQAGDILLQAIGPRLGSVLRQSDTLARLGGDEFAILLPAITSPAAAGLIADRVLAALQDPFTLQGLEIAVEASIGIVVSPADGDDIDLLMQRADVSMYAAKQGRLGAVAFDESLDVYKPEQLSMFGRLRRAIDDGGLLLHYQPKVELGSGQIYGVEALVRWRLPDGTIIPPDNFIPLAERTTLIKPLTTWVLNEALAQCRRWLDDGDHISVAVNICSRSLLDRTFPTYIANLLDAHHVPAELLELEVTESTIMADPGCARDVLDELHQQGVKLSIDDFGTGYSSLAYLKTLPIDTLKIDRSFVTHLSTDDSDAVIVRSVIDLGKNLGLQVIAEGVEDAQTVAILTASGCHTGQGYYWRRPVTATEITASLHTPTPPQ